MGLLFPPARSLPASARRILLFILSLCFSPLYAQLSLAKPDMVFVPGGQYLMGAKDGNSYVAEEFIHPVRLSGFYIGRKELSLAEFRAFVEASGYQSDAERTGGAWLLSSGVFTKDPQGSWKNPGFRQEESEPVLCLSWNDALQYCNWLSLNQGYKPSYTMHDGQWRLDSSASGYRLPTEAEWEYAARGGAATASGSRDNIYPGRGDIGALAWYLDNAASRSHPAGLKAPNILGIFDLSGNAWEWCHDFFSQDFYRSSPSQDPQGPEAGLTRSARGGSWASRARNCRVSQRYARPPGESYSYLGFRLARSAEPPR